MPLTIVLDNGDFLGTTLSEDGNTVQDALVTALTNLLRHLEVVGFNSPIQIVRLSDGATIHAPSTNTASLIMAISYLQIDDSPTQPLEQRLKSVLESNPSLCNPSIFTTALILAFSGNQDSKALSSFQFPDNWAPLWFLYNLRVSKREQEPFKVIAQRTRTKIAIFEFEHEPPALLSSRIHDFVAPFIEPFKANLCLGHIQTPIELSPSPQLSGWLKFSERHRLPQRFPNIITVAGFLPTRAVLLSPSIFRFVLTPNTLLNDKEKFSRIGSPQSNSITTNPNHSEIILQFELIMRSLEASERVGVVNLGKNWFGLLMAQKSIYPAISSINGGYSRPDSAMSLNSESQDSSSAATADLNLLVLHVLPLGVSLPYIGPLSDLVVESNHNPGEIHLRGAIVDPTTMDTDENRLIVESLPLHMTYTEGPSYAPNVKGGVPFLGDDNTLVIEIARLQMFSQDLPSQRVSLFKQCERIREISNLYNMPDLLDTIVNELKNDISKSRNTTLTHIIITRLSEDLKACQFPLSWSESAEEEVQKIREKKKNWRNKKPSWDE